MFGHRFDGKRIRDIDPIVQMTPYLMPMRCDAQVFLDHKLDFEMLSRYIAQKAKEGHKVSFIQLIAAAYVRAVSRHPEINRFIFNKQYFSRNNCSISYTVLKDAQDFESPEVTIRVQFDLTDTVFDVCDRMNDAVEKGARHRGRGLCDPARESGAGCSRTDHGDRRAGPPPGPVRTCPESPADGAAVLLRPVHVQ